jgi:hypothetical protein
MHVFGLARILFGTSGANAGSGTYRVSLPVEADTSLISGSGTGGNGAVVGSFSIKDDGSAAWRHGVLQLVTSTTALLLLDSDAVVTNAVPWTWAASDRIHYQFGYFA